MKKYYFFLIFFVYLNASGKITLLTSLDFSRSANPKRYANYESELANIFRSKLKSTNEEIQIKHKATAYDLWQQQQDPTVTALFWLSEDFYAEKNHPNNGIYTADGFEISELFRALPDHIKYRAIIGCYSSKILKEKNIHLGKGKQIQLFDTIIEAKKSLRLSIQNYFEYINSAQENIPNSTNVETSQNQIKISIKHTNTYNNKNLPELFVIIDNQPLAVLKPLQINETQNIDLYIDESQAAKKIIIKSAKNLYAQQESNLGSISIESQAPYLWTVFSNPHTNRAYGTKSRTFIPSQNQTKTAELKTPENLNSN